MTLKINRCKRTGLINRDLYSEVNTNNNVTEESLLYNEYNPILLIKYGIELNPNDM